MLALRSTATDVTASRTSVPSEAEKMHKFLFLTELLLKCPKQSHVLDNPP